MQIELSDALKNNIRFFSALSIIPIDYPNELVNYWLVVENCFDFDCVHFDFMRGFNAACYDRNQLLIHSTLDLPIMNPFLLQYADKFNRA